MEITLEHRALVLKHIKEASIVGEIALVHFKPTVHLNYYILHKYDSCPLRKYLSFDNTKMLRARRAP